MHRFGGRPGRTAEGEYTHHSVIQLLLFDQDQLVGVDVYFVVEPPDELIGNVVTLGGWETVFVVNVAVHVEAKTISKARHRRNRPSIFARPVRREVHLAGPGPGALHQGQLGWVRHLDRLAHMANHGIREQKDRIAQKLGRVDRFHRQIVSFSHAAGRIGDDGIVAVRPPASLHNVHLARKSWQAGTGAAAHDIHQHQRRLRDNREA